MSKYTPARSKTEVARDQKRVSAYYLKGWSMKAIANELSLSLSTIQRTLKKLHNEWKKSALMDLDEKLRIELAKIDNLERIAWDAWEESCKDAEAKTEKEVIGGRDGSKFETIEHVKGQTGDPRFLQRIEWCIDRRCKLLGIDAPEKIRLGNLDKEGIKIKFGGNISPDDI